MVWGFVFERVAFQARAHRAPTGATMQVPNAFMLKWRLAEQGEVQP